MVLPQAHRLRQRQDFSTVYQWGIKRTTPHLTLRALSPQERGKRKAEKEAKREAEREVARKVASTDPNYLDPNHPALNHPEAIQPTRIGISISQKVSKRAVIRNRIKRQIRAALRQFLPNLAPGWQIVIVVKPGASQCDYEEFLRELEQLLKNAEVLNGH